MSARRTAETRRARKLARRISLARAALIWERLWRAAWPALGLIGLFGALSLFGLWPVLPRWAHLAAWAGFAAALAAALFDGIRRFRVPGIAEAARRLECDNGLAHRPLSVLTDRPAAPTGDPASQTLWRAHQARALQAVRALRLVRPRPGLIERDPWALRHALLLLLVAAIVVSGSDPAQRLRDAFRMPSATESGPPAEIQAWITPPAYTGAPARFLTQRRPDGSFVSQAAADGAIWVPDGSIFSARLGGSGTPKLLVRTVRESNTVRFSEQAPGSYALAHSLNADQTLKVTQGGGTVASWPVRVVPDRPPAISLAAAPGQTERFALAVPYLAEDDYGVTAARIEIRPLGAVPRITKDKQLSMDIALPDSGTRHVQETAYLDLTAHPWAGLPVALSLWARDARGQTATSKPVNVVLPEREFRRPLAKAIIEQRKALAADPAAMPAVAAMLNMLTFRGDRFFQDKVLYLGLRAAYWRLRYADAGTVPEGAYDMLWALALRAEDGELSLAERDLRDATQQLKNALNGDPRGQDFQALSRRLQKALDRFVEALTEQADRQAQQGAETPQRQPGDTTARREDLRDLADRVGKLGQLGDRDAARNLLSQLEDMIQNLQAGAPKGQSQADRKRENALRELSRLMDRQQELLDKSFRQDQGNPTQSDRSAGDGSSQPDEARSGNQANNLSPTPGGRMPGDMDGGGPGQGNGPNGAAPSQQSGGQGELSDRSGQPGSGMGGTAQEKLRRQLGDLMNNLGEETGSIPGALGRAERAMRHAREALDHGQPGEALDPQRQALDQLQQGASMLSRQMRQNTGNGVAGGASNGLGTDRDPLGRPMPTSGPDFGIGQHVPDAPQIERARRILEEIERRASERGRPQEELDYLDRLLRRF